jgi:hypothetical protein
MSKNHSIEQKKMLRHGMSGNPEVTERMQKSILKKGGITYFGIVTAALQNPMRSKINLKPELLSSHTPCP